MKIGPMAAELRPGDVFEYPYLWNWQAKKGETEGRKERPVCLLIALPVLTGTMMVILPITATEPESKDDAVEMPAIEARRAGLAGWKRGWVIVSEANFDSLENSWYFNPGQPPRGRFSPAFLSKISARFQNVLEAGGLRKVSRSE
ncbi:MAG: hypothetical protein ACE5EU_01430 [Paracoccaceae bacterium]